MNVAAISKIENDIPSSGTLFNKPGATSAVPTTRDFTDALLAALIEMAALSPRRQADVAVAMRRAGLAAEPEVIASAIVQLREDHCIEAPLYLSDGGILLSITMHGIEFLSTTSHRHVVAAALRHAMR